MLRAFIKAFYIYSELNLVASDKHIYIYAYIFFCLSEWA